jgi:chemotaxis protein histidine kinase CheA
MPPYTPVKYLREEIKEGRPYIYYEVLDGYDEYMKEQSGGYSLQSAFLMWTGGQGDITSGAAMAPPPPPSAQETELAAMQQHHQLKAAEEAAYLAKMKEEIEQEKAAAEAAYRNAKEEAALMQFHGFSKEEAAHIARILGQLHRLSNKWLQNYKQAGMARRECLLQEEQERMEQERREQQRERREEEMRQERREQEIRELEQKRREQERREQERWEHTAMQEQLQQMKAVAEAKVKYAMSRSYYYLELYACLYYPHILTYTAYNIHSWRSHRRNGTSSSPWIAMTATTSTPAFTCMPITASAC